jgi:hypothetical protein
LDLGPIHSAAILLMKFGRDRNADEHGVALWNVFLTITSR